MFILWSGGMLNRLPVITLEADNDDPSCRHELYYSNVKYNHHETISSEEAWDFRVTKDATLYKRRSGNMFYVVVN